MSREADEWAYDKERGLLDADEAEYRAKTGFSNAREAMKGIKFKPVSKAFPIGDKGHPQIPKGQKVFILRTQMGILGKDNCKNGILKKMWDAIVPPFLIIATDRVAALAEITRLWNALFDACEHTKCAGVVTSREEDSLNKLAIKSAEAFRKRRQAREKKEKALSNLTVRAFEKRRKQYRKEEKRK